ncbi:MAG: hypothetical protein JXQ75_05010 [Phycisphaerae bacterium]|nr:hypothetical protein [Phycisphaerae bacterium]
MPRYANETTVNVERSQGQIKDTLRRYGVEDFGVLERSKEAAIEFIVPVESGGRIPIRITVPLPDRDAEEFAVSDAGRRRKPEAAYRAWEQAVKQRWRALLLAIKAKLEAVETGISTIEVEFMPFIVLGNGETLGQQLLPKLEVAASEGRVLSLPDLAKMR